jgi:L-seryl-tRNA(Ser) seleniumtransferase
MASPETDKRHLPAVSRVLEEPAIVEALRTIPRTLIVKAIRASIDEKRSSNTNSASAQEIAQSAVELAAGWSQRTLRPAINATGIVLHTGLGRAALCSSAQRAVADAAAGHSTLEIDPATGKRGSRQDHVQQLLCDLTGAEAALAVNNNAGATILAVAALATGKDVLISRGELVEIGGSFRIPDIIRASGATLIEVGTTNRTRISDFRNAITERTGLILRCHPSNFKQIGFVESAPISELVELGQASGIPIADDLGSGSILDIPSENGEPVTTLSQAVSSGADLVMASGDKLLGGPQAGLILGKQTVVGRLASHPMARALRIDKLCLSALEATLREYLDPTAAQQNIPTLRYLSRSQACLREMALRLSGMIRETTNDTLKIEVVESESQAGGGALPGEDLKSSCVAISSVNLTSDQIASALRLNSIPIFARIKDGVVLIDPRTLEEEDFAMISEALGEITKQIHTELVHEA